MTEKPHMFCEGRTPGVVVMAPSLVAARRWLRGTPWEGLPYAGEGHPSRPENWACVSVRAAERNARAQERALGEVR